MNNQDYKKEGKSVLPDFKSNEKLNAPELYMPSDGLVDAVNVALTLGQPLLLTGEPGTGKTELAWHLAHQYNLREPLVFTAQTTSTATDLFYKYDALGHFQYNQNYKDPLSIDALEANYIQYNALGEAIRLKERVVVLIDEIDKAPRDFPNDILYALEKLRFVVPELKNRIYTTDKAKRPIIILTSNSEKNLPDAFLRRVVYFNIPFPTPQELFRILNRKTEGFSDEELELVVEHFTKIRSMKLKKAPATAELIYWALLLKDIRFPINKIDGKLNENEKRQLSMSYSILAKNREDLEELKQNI